MREPSQLSLWALLLLLETAPPPVLRKRSPRSCDRDSSPRGGGGGAHLGPHCDLPSTGWGCHGLTVRPHPSLIGKWAIRRNHISKGVGPHRDSPDPGRGGHGEVGLEGTQSTQDCAKYTWQGQTA